MANFYVFYVVFVVDVVGIKYFVWEDNGCFYYVYYDSCVGVWVDKNIVSNV